MATDKTTQDHVDEAVEGFDGAVDKARKGAKSAAASASQAAARLIDQGADGVLAAADRLPEASHWAEDQLENLRDRARAEPLRMIAIAAGIGALFGAFLTR